MLKVRYLRGVLWNRVLSRLPEFPLRRKTQHGRLAFSNRDRVIGRSLFINGEFEMAKIEAALSLLKSLGFLGEPRTLIDIGANVGTVCIPLVAGGTFSKAFAFEPELKNFKYLRKNIEMNGLKDVVEPLNLALSSKKGQMTLELSSDNFGDHRIAVKAGEPSSAKVQVDVTTLDSFLESHGIQKSDIGLIWMDVQGHEKHVLEGSLKTLATGTPVIAEFWPYGLTQSGVSAKDFASFIDAHFDFFYDLADYEPVAAKRHQASEIGLLFARYNEKRFTDLLLIAK